MTAALIVLPLSGGVSTRIHATRTPRSTEERLKEYREALSELDQRIRTMQLADTTQAHPPLQRQTGLQTLSHPPTPWQNCCVIL